MGLDEEDFRIWFESIPVGGIIKFMYQPHRFIADISDITSIFFIKQLPRDTSLGSLIVLYNESGREWPPGMNVDVQSEHIRYLQSYECI